MRCGVYYEKKFREKGYKIIIGVDEAGRGPLAGPVVAAAVALKKQSFKNRIDDSKKLSPLQREKAFPEIIKKSDFAIGIVDEKVIDRINILQATILAMEEAIKKLSANLKEKNKQLYILVDGNVKLRPGLPLSNIIKGDAKSKSIAAASIIAKVTRDRIMCLYDKAYPQYGFSRHKGYPTKAHRMALNKFGPSDIHRKSFCSA
ncbi:MAG: ribonuclease HII [Candidatus Omnitrophica bacterium]|nr:ribonuclease HII [Candidatus Omnitrophota bacterium]